MKIVFYPRDIGMFRNGEFDFSLRHSSTLAIQLKTDYKVFHDYESFIEWLKSYGVKLDDPKHPLIIKEQKNEVFGTNKVVVQWSLVGWIKEVY